MHVSFGVALKGLTTCRRHCTHNATSIICIVGIALVMGRTIDVARAEDLMELTCTHTAHCQHYQHAATVKAACNDGHCQCTNMNGVRVKCQPNVHNKNNIIGGPCPCGQPKTQCNDDERICYCIEGYMASTDRRRCIRKQVPLNAACEMDEQCQASGNYMAFCHPANGTCSCMDGFIDDDNQEKCLPSVVANDAVNATCLEDDNCLLYGPNAECFKFDVCVCREGYVVPPNSTVCTEAIGYGRNCSSDLQCQYSLGFGGTCKDNGLCGCLDNYWPYTSSGNESDANVQCHRMKVPGQYCYNNTDCEQLDLTDGSVQTMRCVYGECNCKEGYRLNMNSQCRSGVVDGLYSGRNFVGALITGLMCLSLYKKFE